MNDDIMQAAIVTAGYELAGSPEAESRRFAAQGLDVAWEDVDDTNEVMIWCAVGDMPEEPKAEFTRYLLEANCFGSETSGGYLGLYSLAQVLIYSYRLVLDADEEVTAKVLQAFVAKALQIKSKLNDLQSLAEEGDEADGEEEAGAQMMQMSSIRI